MSRFRVPNVHADEVYAANYEKRRQIAEEGNAALRAAIEACGPGAASYARWVLVDKLGLIPDRIVYCCRRDDGCGWQPAPSFADRFERLGPENHPGFEVKGELVYPFRFTESIGVLSAYVPQSPERAKAAAERRQAAALAKVREDLEQQQQDEARRPTLFAWAGIEEGPAR